MRSRINGMKRLEKFLLVAGASAYLAGCPLTDYSVSGTEVHSAGSVTNPNPNTTIATDNILYGSLVEHVMPDIKRLGFHILQDGASIKSLDQPTTYNSTTNRYETIVLQDIDLPLKTSSINLDLKYCPLGQSVCNSSQTLFPTTESDDPNAIVHSIKLKSDLRIAKIWFHNVNNGSTTTTVSESSARKFVDAGLNRADSILSQCSSDNRWQLRFHKLDTVNIKSEAELTNYMNLTHRHLNSGNPNQLFADDYVHVFLVNDFFRKFQSLPSYGYIGQDIILLKAGLNEEDSSMNLARAFAHLYWLDEAGKPNLRPACKESISTDSCSNTDIKERNLMCESGGHKLTSSQCARLYKDLDCNIFAVHRTVSDWENFQ